MGPLLFVNWQTMHLGLRALMWLLAIGRAPDPSVASLKAYAHATQQSEPCRRGGGRR
jgi:hypothetical protein